MNKSVIDIMKAHTEIKCWDIEVYSITNDYTETVPDEKSFLYGDMLLELDEDYSYYGAVDEDLEFYHEQYGDIDDPDDYGMLSSFECEFNDFDVKGDNAYISLAMSDTEHHILNPEHIYKCRKVWNTGNGDTYILLREYENTVLLCDEYGHYVVGLGTIKEDDTHFCWCQGMYFVGHPQTTPKGDTLERAIEYFEKKIKEK